MVPKIHSNSKNLKYTVGLLVILGGIFISILVFGVVTDQTPELNDTIQPGEEIEMQSETHSNKIGAILQHEIAAHKNANHSHIYRIKIITADIEEARFEHLHADIKEMGLVVETDYDNNIVVTQLSPDSIKSLSKKRVVDRITIAPLPDGRYTDVVNTSHDPNYTNESI